MQVSTDSHDSCSDDRLGKDVSIKFMSRTTKQDPMPACGVRNFYKDCTTTLLTKDGDRKDKLTSNTSPTTGHMKHSLTVSTP